MDNDQKLCLYSVAKAATDRDLVILVGSGVSKNSGLPSWVELAELTKTLLSSANNLESDWIKNHLLEYFEQFDATHQRAALTGYIKQLCENPSVKHNILHEALFSLLPVSIITTNYDSLLETYNREKECGYTLLMHNADFASRQADMCILKMHGNAADQEIVISKSDYDDYAMKYRLLHGHLLSLIARSHVLMIGFSGDDPNVSHILRIIKTDLQKHSRGVYLCSSSIEDDFSDNDAINSGLIKVIRPLDESDLGSSDI